MDFVAGDQLSKRNEKQVQTRQRPYYLKAGFVSVSDFFFLPMESLQVEQSDAQDEF